MKAMLTIFIIIFCLNFCMAQVREEIKNETVEQKIVREKTAWVNTCQRYKNKFINMDKKRLYSMSEVEWRDTIRWAILCMYKIEGK